MKAKKVLPALLFAAGAAVGYAVYKVAKEKIELEKAQKEDYEDEVIYQKVYRKDEPQKLGGDDSEKQLAPFQEVEGSTEKESLKEEPKSETNSSLIQDTSKVEEPVTNEEAQLNEESAKYSFLTDTVVDAIEEYSDETIDELFQSGDNATIERPIQHYVSFKSTDGMNEFKKIVQEANFVVTNGDTPTELVVLHISDINKDKLLNNILFIADTAYANDGVYHGWACRVTK